MKLKKTSPFKPIHYKKTLLFCLKGLLLLGFLYCWNHWTLLMLMFSEDHHISLIDYLFALPFNIGLLAALLPFNLIFMSLSLAPIILTSYSYISTLIFGQAWQSAIIGISMNGIAICFFAINLKKKKI